jgi:hypothetical protein
MLKVFESLKKDNFFAPEWKYYIYENFIEGLDFNSIRKIILKKEKDILKNTKSSYKDSIDGYTGLGKNSLTSRYQYFNVLKWKNKQIKNLEKNIIRQYKNFLKELNLEIPKHVYVQCWANVMRNKEQIKPHIHNVSNESYLSGHVCITNQDSSTFYINPVNQINDPEVYESKNKQGKFTLFQSCIPHYTSVYNGNKERITIAFDLFLKEPSNTNFKKII